MEIKTGVDIVYLPRFRKVLRGGGQKFLQRVFFPEELTQATPHHLAGIFAAKEAIIKALRLPLDSWHDITITTTKNGAPKAQLLNHKSSIINHSLSISHDGNYVIAFFVALVK